MISSRTNRRVPRLLKAAFFLFMLVWFPSQLIGLTPENLLWFSNVTLLLVFLATLFESKWLASLAFVGDFVYALLWNVDFFFLLLFPSLLPNFTGYMVNPEIPLTLRILSLYHVALPPLMLFLVLRLGYERRAWSVQILLSTLLIIVSRLVTSPERNINAVFGYEKFAFLPEIHAVLYLFLLMGLNALCVLLTHLGLTYYLRGRK